MSDMEGARESREYVGGVSEEQRSEQERRFEELGGWRNSSGASSGFRAALTTWRPNWLS
jgi:hypothetical protein